MSLLALRYKGPAFCSRAQLFAYLSTIARSTSGTTTRSQDKNHTSTERHLRQARSLGKPSEAPPLTSTSPQHRLLEPYELSRRILKLCGQDNIDGAVEMLQNAPLASQNIKVWNTLLVQCLDTCRYQLAFRLFTDVRDTSRVHTLSDECGLSSRKEVFNPTFVRSM